jgi:hypothetical protein
MMELAEKVLSPLKSDQPAQKAPEPEMFICPNSGKKYACTRGCIHSDPHEHTEVCEEGAESGGCLECIPVKESAPQMQPHPRPVICNKANMTEMCGTCGHRTLHDPIDNCVGGGVCGGLCVVPVEAEKGVFPGMAKDIGNLIIRMDNLESGLVDRVNALDEDFTNTANVVFKQKAQIKELETAMKAIQKEIDLLKRNTP